MKTHILIISLILTSCASVSEKTVSTMDEQDRPEWATQSKAVTIKDGKMIILGFQELDADAKISAAFRLSDNSSRSEFSKILKTEFSSILQNLEEGTTDSCSLSRFYSSEVSKSILSEMQITERYWEKVKSFDQDGEPTYRLR